MKILVVGAGFAGATVARTLAEAGHQVDVIDRRDHIAGNAYDYVNEHGIRIHKYGPHIFHTSNQKVVDWLSQFTDWVEYRHKVLAKINTNEFHILPINRKTTATYSKEEILNTFYRPYTQKMWGLPLEMVNPKIFDRVPIRDDDNELYFPNDSFQAMPKNGYTEIFKRIFDHTNITIKLSTAFNKNMESNYDHIFSSMAIDEYYDYCHGELPYRSIRFETITLPESQIYNTSVTNFTTTDGPTRVTEWKLFEEVPPKSHTTLTYEFPCDYKENNEERYYPINDISGKNQGIYKKYSEIKNDKVIFIGRCGNYLYLDMHQVISSSLSVARDFITKNPR